MALPLNRAALARVVPFAAFMVLLAVRGAVPEDGSWGIDPRWLYGASVLVVGGLLAWFWRDYGELVSQTMPSLAEAASSSLLRSPQRGAQRRPSCARAAARATPVCARG